VSDAPRRRLILHMAVSLDGFSANGNGAPEWRAEGDAPAGPDHGDARHRANVELVAQMGLIVIGRGAYEDMVRAWPGSDSPMGRLMNTLPKVVFSDSLETVEWENARLNEHPLEAEMARLKAAPGRDIIAFGGGRLAHSLIAARLVDEYRLTVHPVALGRGIPLMHDLPDPQRYELVNAAVYTDGSIVLTLRPEAGR
jgi:dihydrofolate reductase